MNSRLNKTKNGDAIPDGFLELMSPILKAKMWELERSLIK